MFIPNTYHFLRFRHCERGDGLSLSKCTGEAISYKVLFKIASFLAMTRCILGCFFFLCFINGAFAQTYPFVNHTVETGLSQAQVLCAFQDDDGVMWFGTNGGGITKFDGKFYEYINDKDGLPDNIVYCIKKHPADGSILIGTNNGLSVFHPNLWQHGKQKAFTNYTTNQGLTHNRIFTIVIDKQNRVLLGTGNGLSEYKNGKCQTLNISEGINNAPIFHILQDSKNIFWYSTMGLGVFKHQGNIIENFTSAKNGLSHDMVFATYEYGPDLYWFLTGEGITKFNNVSKILGKENLFNEQYTYYSIIKDHQNNIWLGTDNGALKLERNHKIKIFNSTNGLCDNNIWNIYLDNENNLFFLSSESGISKIKDESFVHLKVKNGLISNVINSINQSKDVYYLGTNNGISCFKSNKFTNFDSTVFKSQTGIFCIHIKDNEKGLFLGTTKGMVDFNNSIDRVFFYNQNKNSNINVIRSICKNENTLYLGTEKGLAYIDGEDGIKEVKGFKNMNYFVYGITKYQNDLWLSSDVGLIKYTPSQIYNFTIKDGMTEKKSRNCLEDKKGNLWIASSDGIYKYEKGKFTNISKQLALPSKDIYSIAIDTNQTIWVGLSEGLGKISEINGSYKTKFYDKDDGFLGGVCSENAIFIDDKNHVLVGTQDGLVIFQPEYDRDNTLEPFTKIKSIDLFSQKTDWSQHVDSISANGLPYNLTLPYNKNYLTFHFIGVTQSTPNKVKYQYMLKGIHTDWRSTTKNELVFDNLPFGEYEFILKAENGEGVWNKEPLVYKFTITPPFWRTWWFYSIIAAIGLGFVYSYLQIRRAKNHILKQKEMIESKNEALNKANIEIADINKNITDSINYAKRIQNSFLTTKGLLRHILKEHFILFKPKDVVSGDFYWAFEFEDRVMVVCADCTGHGIPGAFMSLINISLLNEISHSKNILQPAEILEEIRRIIIQALNPYLQEDGAKDGMDVTLISIFKQTNNEDTFVKIHLSGGNNPLFIVPISKTTEMVEYKVDKQPVGYYINMKPFTQQEIIAQKGDMLYLFTDGFPDQFGGDKGKKFMSKQLKKQLLDMSQQPCKEQNHLLEKLFNDWKGKLEQVDDVTVIGIRL